MKKIYKYELPLPQEGTEIKVFLPKGMEILSCGFQEGKLYTWGIVDVDEERKDGKIFFIVMTGEVLPELIRLTKFIGTAHDNTGPMPFVLHVFLKSN